MNEYMGIYKKINQTLLKKRKFYSHLNIEDITNKDHEKAKRVQKEFEINNLLEYHKLCVQSGMLLLADIF